MQRVGLALALVTALAGCENPEKKLIAAAENDIRERFSDPRSAQFKQSFVHINEGPIRSSCGLTTFRSEAVCGEVNAKNAYGGYVGFRPFYYVYHSEICGREDHSPKRPFVGIVRPGARVGDDDYASIEGWNEFCRS